MTCSRKSVVVGGLGASALALTGCGSGEDDAAAPSEATSGGPGSGTGSSSSTGSSGDSSSDASSGATGERIPASDVPVGGGVVRDRVVLTQPTAGQFHAFDATCPHQGCAVSTVSAEAIICPCHGSAFDPGTGEVTQGPAESGLTPVDVTVDGDEVVLG